MYRESLRNDSSRDAEKRAVAPRWFIAVVEKEFQNPCKTSRSDPLVDEVIDADKSSHPKSVVVPARFDSSLVIYKLHSVSDIPIMNRILSFNIPSPMSSRSEK